MRKPTEEGIRGPQAGQKNGGFLNPPRYPESTGLTSPGKIKQRSEIEVVPPGIGRGYRLPPLPRGTE